MAAAFLLWTVFAALCFAFALAIQMRIILGVIVARALRARDETLGIKASRLAMVRAGNGERDDDLTDHIHATYPEQVRQLRLARKVSVITPLLIIATLVLWRVFGQVS
jgi:hypothetical protein